MKPTNEQINAAARALSNDNADVCNVNREDNWNIYGDSFIETARVALEAAMGVALDVDGARDEVISIASLLAGAVLNYPDFDDGEPASAKPMLDIARRLENAVCTALSTPPPAKLPTETVDKGVDRLTTNDVGREIFRVLKPGNMIGADWDSGAILGADNGFRNAVMLAAQRVIELFASSDSQGAADAV
jgi:hypothetical protein